MPTIAQQLTQLESDRQDLVDNLETKGITGLTGDETFTELVPEVLNIPSGGDINDYFLSTLIPSSHSSENGISKSLKTIPSNMTIQSGTTDLGRMFQYCSNLTTVPLFDTSNITSMAFMFQSCSNLTEVPFFNTSKVTNMNSMFSVCSSLTEVPLFDMSNVTSASYMFSSCYSLTEVPLFDTSKVTNASYMFISCTSLTTVPLLDTSSVTNFTNMFSSCHSLSNNSLNNIMAMCIGATSYTGTKTLQRLGLTSTQATICTGLSNYSSFTAAGWTTGY